MRPKTVEIDRLLPAIFQRALGPDDRAHLARWAGDPLPAPNEAPLTPLAALLDVMAYTFGQVEARFDAFPESLHPDRAWSRFLPMLARWLHVDLALAPDEVALRALIGRAARLWRLRGTERGLNQALETVLGPHAHRVTQPKVEIQSRNQRLRGGRFEAFHIRVSVRPEFARHESAVERVIHAMKPAHVSHTLHFDFTPEDA